MRIAVKLGALIALLFSALPAFSDCDKCEDLCRLVDRYLQEEKGIELWKQYAASTPEQQRAKLPAEVNDTRSMENHFGKQFNDWLKNRQLPCKRPEGPEVPTVSTLDYNDMELETVITNDSCAITYHGQNIDEGQTKQIFQAEWACKPLSDALEAHERVHQEHCMEAYAKGQDKAQQILNTPANVAESELQAWTKHKEVVAEAIRNLVRQKGCGWQPTKGQKNDINAVPSAKQTMDMQQRLFKAAKTLSRGKH
jgi:hypothetical protein